MITPTSASDTSTSGDASNSITTRIKDIVAIIPPVRRVISQMED